MRRFRIMILMVCFVAIIVWGCNNKSPAQVEYEQSYEAGKAWFGDNCAKCHKAEGEGVGTLYPPLANSDYLKNNEKMLSCIIKNGLHEELTVNGIQYHWVMPGNGLIDNIKIAELVTYLRGRWGNEKVKYTYEQVVKDLQACENKDAKKLFKP